MKKLGFGFTGLPMKQCCNDNIGGRQDNSGSNDSSSNSHVMIAERTEVDIAQVQKMVDTLLEQGFTYFDTAYMAQDFKGEIYLRDALVKRYPRECFTIATKLPLVYLRKEEDMEEIFAEQLRKCGVEYFDYYMLQDLGEVYLNMVEGLDCFGFLCRLKEQGRVRSIGFSFRDDAGLLDRILTEHPEVDFVQLRINYLDWDDVCIQSRRCYEVAARHGKKIIAMEPVGNGSLAKLPDGAKDLLHMAHPDWSAASWAIRFAASKEGVHVVVSGMSSLEQLYENVACLNEFVPLHEEEARLLTYAIDMFHQEDEMFCKGCRCCEIECMKQIPIPEYLAVYRGVKKKESEQADRDLAAKRLYYENYARRFAGAEECSGCKKCERLCPQGIGIAKIMKYIADVMAQESGI